MRVLVCGGRDFNDYCKVCAELDDILSVSGMLPDPIVIIHGGARGADALANAWALDNLIPIKCYPADWAKHGSAAGPIRNKRMLDEGRPDLVVAFPGGKGTANMVQQARAAGIKVIEAT